MRDVDLFVGVAGVGNDPEWQDRGATREERDYWQAYSFGDLTEVARTRKAVLERLLPRLRIRDQAHIDGKFLIVDGKRHSYKIHIGSTNILILPNDRYLCIVPKRGKDRNTDDIPLPFEGDRGLSIILSKAFMLADDDKITDPTIVSQLSTNQVLPGVRRSSRAPLQTRLKRRIYSVRAALRNSIVRSQDSLASLAS